MHIEGPVERSEKWALEYIEGTMLKDGKKPLYASRARGGPDTFRLYYIDENGSLIKSLLTPTGTKQPIKLKIDHEPPHPVYEKFNIAKKFGLFFLVGGSVNYYMHRDMGTAIIAGLVSGALFAGLPAMITKKVLDVEYEIDRKIWERYMEHLVKGSTSTPE